MSRAILIHRLLLNREDLRHLVEFSSFKNVEREIWPKVS